MLPDNVTVTFNGDRLLARKPIRTFEASLETPVADESGVMRLRVRKTRVGIYEPLPGEVPGLYEMGLPIVETGDRWHVSVEQKVPLNRDRDNVRPAYLQAVRVAVLNAAHDLLTTDEEATAPCCKLAGGDFFDSVPAGPDAYLLKHVLHDWDDASATAILTNCRKAMGTTARLLIVEHVMPEKGEQGRAQEAYLLDREMLVLTPGGRERTEAEFRAILSEAGLAMARVIPTAAPVSIIEARPEGRP